MSETFDIIVKPIILKNAILIYYEHYDTYFYIVDIESFKLVNNIEIKDKRIYKIDKLDEQHLISFDNKDILYIYKLENNDLLQIYEFKFDSKFFKFDFLFNQRDLTSLENDKSIFSLSDKKLFFSTKIIYIY